MGRPDQILNSENFRDIMCLLCSLWHRPSKRHAEGIEAETLLSGGNTFTSESFEQLTRRLVFSRNTWRSSGSSKSTQEAA